MDNAIMKKISQKHLIGSKWTHRIPVERDKHFVVARVYEGENESAGQSFVELRAVLSKRIRILRAAELENTQSWQSDWR